MKNCHIYAQDFCLLKKLLEKLVTKVYRKMLFGVMGPNINWWHFWSVPQTKWWILQTCSIKWRLDKNVIFWLALRYRFSETPYRESSLKTYNINNNVHNLAMKPKHLGHMLLVLGWAEQNKYLLLIVLNPALNIFLRNKTGAYIHDNYNNAASLVGQAIIGLYSFYLILFDYERIFVNKLSALPGYKIGNVLIREAINSNKRLKMQVEVNCSGL